MNRQNIKKQTPQQMYKQARDKAFFEMNTDDSLFFSKLFLKEKEIAKNIFHDYPELMEQFFDSKIDHCLTLLKVAFISNSKHLTTQTKQFNNSRWEDSNIYFKELYNELGDELFNKIPHSFINKIVSDSSKIDLVKDILNKGYQLTNNVEVINTAITKGDKELFHLALSANSCINPLNTRKLNIPLSFKSLFFGDSSKEKIEELTLYFWDKLVQHGADVNILDGHKHLLVSNASNYDRVYFEWLLKNNANPDISWKDDLGAEHTLSDYVERNAPALKPILDKYLLNEKINLTKREHVSKPVI